MRITCFIFVVVLFAANFAVASPMVKSGDRVAVFGDSITEQKVYSCYIEAYLLASSGLKDIQVFTYGWGGDNTAKLAERIEMACNWFNPTVATIFYGMNDGQYQAYNNSIGSAFHKSMSKIAAYMNRRNVKFLIGSPGAVDSFSFKKSPQAAQIYNQNLEKLGEIASNVAKENHAEFFDLHHVIMNSMAAAKGKNGEEYQVLGKDGVHPGANGQLIIAYGFLKGLGFDGDIATIDFDYATGKAELSEGVRQLSGTVGNAEFESIRYPFCFNRESPEMLPFLPFNEELNRFMLKVDNLPAEHATVQFGETEKVFSKAELEKGINLADFVNNPFLPHFINIFWASYHKQELESKIYKEYLSVSKAGYDWNDSRVQSAFRLLDAVNLEKWKRHDAAIRAAHKPVKFKITVLPQK